MRHLNITLNALCIALTVVVCGCGRNDSASGSRIDMPAQVKPTDLAILRHGVGINQVLRLLGGPGEHQFSARLEDGDFECVSYSFEKPFVRYYFVFTSGGLRSIVKPPVFEVEQRPYRGVSREVKKPIQPEKRIFEVLAAEALFGDRFVAALEGDLSKLPGHKRSFNVLPAFLLTSKEFARADDKVEAAYRRNALLAEKFNPAKVKLGDKEDVLRSLYGTPLNVIESEGQTTRTYRFGSNEPLRVNPAHRFSGVAVVVEKEAVVRVFSHDFFE